QFSTIGAALRRHDPAMQDGPHFRRVLGLCLVGVVPEVEAVHALVVEPQTDVMRMIDALAWPRIERPAARYDGPLRAADRIEHRLLHAFGPEVGGERRAADGDVHAPRRFV